MKSFPYISIAALLLAAAPLAGAAGFPFDGGPAGFSVYDSLEAEVPALPAVKAAPAPSRVYDFDLLYRKTGYPSPDYFGSTDDEIMDVETYISKDDNYYGEINGYLRYYPEPYEWYGITPASAKEMVERIDRVIERAPAVPGDLVVFRGLGLGWRGNRPFAEGEEFTDKAYVSTSLSFSVARYFAVEKDPDETSRRAVFVIYFTRPEERGLLIDQGEDELMLGHGRRFRVMAEKEAPGTYDLYLVQACAEKCETALRPAPAAFWSDFTVGTE